MTKKYSNPYLTFRAFHLPFEEGFQLIKNKISRKKTSEMNKVSNRAQSLLFY